MHRSSFRCGATPVTVTLPAELSTGNLADSGRFRSTIYTDKERS